MTRNLLFVFILISAFVFGQNESFVWGKTFSSSGDATSKSIIKDNFGNLYITGSFKNSISFGTITLTSKGKEDIYVTKLDADGNAIWAKSFGGSGSDEGSVLLQNQEGQLYLGGNFEESMTLGNDTFTSSGYQDIFVAKLSETGNVMWGRSGGGLYYDTISDMYLDSSNNVVIGARFLGNIVFNNISLTSKGDYDFFVAKMNPSGEINWAKSYGGEGDDYARSLTLDEQNNIYVTGYIGGKTTFGSVTYSVNGISDIFVLKMDQSGNIIWSKKTGGVGYDEGTKIIKDKNGQIYFAGYFAGTAVFGNQTLTSAGVPDVFISRIDKDGNFLWTVRAGGANVDIPRSMVSTDSGYLFVGGIFTDIATFGAFTLTGVGNYSSNFVTKLNATNGEFLWADAIRGSRVTSGGMMLNDNNLYLNGDFIGQTTFGPSISLSGSASTNIFIIKIKVQLLNTEEDSDYFKVVPNPTKNVINIVSKDAIKSMIVKDQNNRMVLGVYDKKSIDLGKLENGIYYLIITTGQEKIVRKIIKQ